MTQPATKRTSLRAELVPTTSFAGGNTTQRCEYNHCCTALSLSLSRPNDDGEPKCSGVCRWLLQQAEILTATCAGWVCRAQDQLRLIFCRCTRFDGPFRVARILLLVAYLLVGGRVAHSIHPEPIMCCWMLVAA